MQISFITLSYNGKTAQLAVFSIFQHSMSFDFLGCLSWNWRRNPQLNPPGASAYLGETSTFS